MLQEPQLQQPESRGADSLPDGNEPRGEPRASSQKANELVATGAPYPLQGENVFKVSPL